ncbi:lipid A deacylase LpxR family protein [Flavicella sp.]|uniref:lipid A deacylase LpxR family protein n=1 Tax=Flavicella sp. TaxID=2957742 RepID=UPI00301934A1
MKTQIYFILFTFFLLLGTGSISGQKYFSKEIGLISDNDLYVSTYYDRYYTNGTFLYFRYLSKTSHEKKLHEFRIGHQMYTPKLSNLSSLEDIDRPYAGYLFASYSQLFFSKKNYGIKYSFELGLLGPDAMAQDLQNVIHNIYGFKSANGWDSQIENTLGINLEFIFLKPFNNTTHKRIDFTFVSSCKLGTIFSEVNTNIYGRFNLLGKQLNSYSNSLLFGTNLNTVAKQQKKELFLFLKPQLGYALYNATIQGSLFNNDSPITFGINSIIYELEFGIKYAIKHFDLSYSIIKYSKKTEVIEENTNTYGTIHIAYKFN